MEALIHIGGVLKGLDWQYCLELQWGLRIIQMLLKQNSFAMLVGFHELCSMGGLNAIIEGYSFAAIQWCSKKSSRPPRLAG